MTNLRKGQVRLGPQTWAVIREAYLSGASGAALAETYGCSLGTIRYRAVREGWRRCDAEGAAPVELTAPEAEALSLEALNDLAIAAAGKALRAGRPSEAAAYIRVAEALQRLGAPGPGGSGACEMIPATEIEARREEFEERILRIQATLAEKQGRQGRDQLGSPGPAAPAGG